MSRRAIFIGLIIIVVVGVTLALTIGRQGSPTDVTEPEESEEPAEPEPEGPEVMTIGDFISRLVVEEYQWSIEGKEPTIKEGITVRVLGRVKDFQVGGEYPHFSGEVDLTPYYCFRRVQCIFEGESVAQLENLEKDQDVIIEGEYGGMVCYEFSRDICRLVNCSLLSIESSQNWTVPMPEEMTADVMAAEYLSNWDVQSKLSKGDPVRIFGSVYSVTIDWSYLEGIWGDVLVSHRGVYGTQCRFEGEEVYKIMKLPEEQEVIIEGAYDYGTANCAYLSNCSLIYP
jgi:hypothetical protein